MIEKALKKVDLQTTRIINKEISKSENRDTSLSEFLKPWLDFEDGDDFK